MSKYQIGRELFPTKKAVQEKCKAILKNGVTIDDYTFLLALFQRHPFAHVKIGDGIQDIFIGETQYKTKCFYIKQKSELVVDISYLQCLTPVSHSTKVKHVFRSLIREQILNYKKNKFDESYFSCSLKCAITGESLTWENCHVDHHFPMFHELLNRFFESRDLTADDIKVVDRRYGWSLDDSQSQIGQDWQDWHEWEANLRLVTAKANLSRAKNNQMIAYD